MDIIRYYISIQFTPFSSSTLTMSVVALTIDVRWLLKNIIHLNVRWMRCKLAGLLAGWRLCWRLLSTRYGHNVLCSPSIWIRSTGTWLRESIDSRASNGLGIASKRQFPIFQRLFHHGKLAWHPHTCTAVHSVE